MAFFKHIFFKHFGHAQLINLFREKLKWLIVSSIGSIIVGFQCLSCRQDFGTLIGGISLIVFFYVFWRRVQSIESQKMVYNVILIGVSLAFF